MITCLLTLAVLCSQSGPDGLTITMEGRTWKPYVVSMEGDSDHPRPGDLLFPARYGIVLEDLQPHRLRLKDKEGILMRDLDGGVSRPVAAHVSWSSEKKGRSVTNPLATLSADEMRGLRGLRLDFWSPEIAEKVKLIDAARCCVTLGGGCLKDAGNAVPPLPAGLHALVFDDFLMDEGVDLSTLRALKDLQYLDLDRWKGPFDLSSVQAARGLRILELGSNELRNLPALEGMAELRLLNLSWNDKVDDLAFAKGLRSLRILRIQQTKVRDLTPLEGLEHLEVVNADSTPVDRLPAGGLPALRTLRIMSSRVKSIDAGAFAKSHPKCRVWHDWQRAFETTLEGATRLLVREGGTCHRQGDEKTLFETADAKLVREAIATISVSEDESGFHCMCCGEPTLEFYKDRELILSLGFHHGRSVRWPSGWPGDALLTRESAAALIDWLDKHGAPGPRKAIEAAKEEARAEELRVARATVGLPEAVVKAFREGNEQFQAALARELPDPERRIAVLFRVFGISNGVWWQLEWMEQRAEEALKKADPAAIRAAAAKALLGDDRLVRRGAARAWDRRVGALSDWMPGNSEALRGVVLTVKQESRTVALRQQAQDNLREWAIPDRELLARLEAGLSDPHPAVRAEALLTAARLGRRDLAPLLLDRLAGKAATVRALPPVPEEEARGVSEDSANNVAGGRPEAEVAALALGLLGHAEAAPLLRPQADASPMAAVALALLGEPERLKPEHFAWKKESNKDLQMAAVEAVVRCKGRVGLSWAIAYEQSEYWWEPETVARMLGAMLAAEKAPGAEALAGTKRLEALDDWFKAHGAEYLKRLQK